MELIEIEEIDGVDGMNDMIEQSAIESVGTMNNFVEFVVRPMSIVVEMVSAVSGKGDAINHLGCSARIWSQCGISMDSDSRKFSCIPCSDSNFFLFRAKK